MFMTLTTLMNVLAWLVVIGLAWVLVMLALAGLAGLGHVIGTVLAAIFRRHAPTQRRNSAGRAAD